jgi:hypothetical protein
MSRDAKLDLQVLRDKSDEARRQVQEWPAWKQEAVQTISAAAASQESRKALEAISARQRKSGR